MKVLLFAPLALPFIYMTKIGSLGVFGPRIDGEKTLTSVNNEETLINMMSRL